MSLENKRLGAVVLAAGLSSRMGTQKLLLPWKESSVICTVVDTLIAAGIEPIVVVAGRDAEHVTVKLAGREVSTIFNPDFSNGNMVDSLRVGLRTMDGKVDAALMVLGDQPQMEVETVHKVAAAWLEHPDRLCIPSWQMRRGHPWVIPEEMWADLFSLKADQTMRDFINLHVKDIHYVLVNSGSILADLDTPEDYQNEKGIPN